MVVVTALSGAACILVAGEVGTNMGRSDTLAVVLCGLLAAEISHTIAYVLKMAFLLRAALYLINSSKDLGFCNISTRSE